MLLIQKLTVYIYLLADARLLIGACLQRQGFIFSFLIEVLCRFGLIFCF